MQNWMNGRPLRARLNTEILTKTEIALEAIKRNDFNESHSFLLDATSNHGLLKNIDLDYSRLTAARRIQPNVIVPIQEYYSIQVGDRLFPMRLLFRDVRNKGTIFVGYDHPHPEMFTNFDEKQYDCKAAVSKDTLLVLRNNSHKAVKKVYFTITANQELFMFNIKIDFGAAHLERIATEPSRQIKPLKSSSSVFITRKVEGVPDVGLQADLTRMPSINKKNSQDHNFQEDKNRAQSLQRLSKERLTSVDELKRQSSIINKRKAETIEEKRERSIEKAEQIKSNRQNLQAWKLKERQLRETASKCKRLIESYQKVYDEDAIKSKKLILKLVPFLEAARFVYSANFLYRKRVRTLSMATKVNYLAKKFAKKIKKSYFEAVNCVPHRAKRNALGVFYSTNMLGKTLFRQSTLSAARLIHSALANLLPGLIGNHIMNRATLFRTQVRLIQRAWLTKYRARKVALLDFVQRHVATIVKSFPHLKQFVPAFQGNKVADRISCEYMYDESRKFVHIHEAYLARIAEIQEITKAQAEQAEQAKRKMEKEPKVKNKLNMMSPYKVVQTVLEIPKRPTRPMHRFFRNLDILKAMVRAWFELQHKKWLKKQTK